MALRESQAVNSAFPVSMLLILSVFLLMVSSDLATSADTATGPMVKEQEVRFADGNTLLAGTLFRPASGAGRGAVVILAGSDRSARGPLRMKIARYFAEQGMTALVYDSPGTGSSSGNALLQSRGDRVTEALSAVNYLRSLPEMRARAVGLFGGSEGADIALLAAARDSRISFVIAVSGAIGGSVLDIMRYSAEKRGNDQGLSLEEIAKATTFKELAFALFSGLDIVEWPLVECRVDRWQDDNWGKLIAIARQRQQSLAAQEKQELLDSLRQVIAKFKTERWFAVVDAGNAIQRLVGMDASQFFTLLEKGPFALDWERGLGPEVASVACPVLAVWGQDDMFVPPHQSAARLRVHLSASGHSDYEIKIAENASHYLTVPGSRTRFVPEYLDTLASWLDRHLPARGT